MSLLPRLRPHRALVAATPVLLLAAAAIALSAMPGDSREDVHDLISTTRTLLDQPIAYPRQVPAKITAAIITLKPGDKRGWHKHPVPLVGYVLDGELTIDLGPRGKRVYKKGEAFVEAIDVPHNGRNLGAVPVRILAVFLGAEGVPTTVSAPGG